MSLEKDGVTFVAQCDFCPDYTDTDETEFMSAVEKIKQEGWVVFKKGKEWFHKCEACQDKETSVDFDDL